VVDFFFVLAKREQRELLSTFPRTHPNVIISCTATLPSLQIMSCHECSSESYDKAEAWCRETVSAGHGMLFSTELFAAEMTRVSRELGVSVQVSTCHIMNFVMAFSNCFWAAQG